MIQCAPKICRICTTKKMICILIRNNNAIDIIRFSLFESFPYHTYLYHDISMSVRRFNKKTIQYVNDHRRWLGA